MPVVVCYVIDVKRLFAVLKDVVSEDPIDVVRAIEIQILAVLVEILLKLRERARAQQTGSSIEAFGEVIVKPRELCRKPGRRLAGAANGIEEYEMFGRLFLAQRLEDTSAMEVLRLGQNHGTGIQPARIGNGQRESFRHLSVECRVGELG